VAPFFGGWLLAAGSWRWVFLINVPIALLVVLVTLRHLPESKDESAPGSLDLVGAAGSCVCLGAATYVLIDAGTRSLVLVAAAGAVAVIFFVAFLWWERRVRFPLLPLELFGVRQFSAANAVTLLAYGAISTFFLLIVLQLQVVAGWTPLAAGAAIIPVTVLTLALSARSGALAQRIGPRIQMSVGPALCAGGTALALRIGPGADYLSDVLPAVLLFGLGLATMVAPLTSAALGSVPAEHAGIASGVNNAVARTASLLAIAAIPVLAGLAGDALANPVRFGAGYTTGMGICIALFIAATLTAWTTIRRPDRCPNPGQDRADKQTLGAGPASATSCAGGGSLR
jgi:Major Facilitator Superfamily